MASNETAALVVALSAQVSKFQKDMDQAVGIVDKAVKRMESRFSDLNKAVDKQISALKDAATSQFGGLGNVLLGLGPIGIAAAVAIGGIVLAFNAASNAAKELAEKAKQIKDLAESTGLTTNELQALTAAAGKVGITSEAVGSFIERFTVNLDQLRHGSGSLLEGLLRINPALAEQLATSRSTAEAITILSQAYKGLGIAQQNALSRAAGGRSGIELTRLLSAGINVGQLTAELTAAGKGIDENLIKKLVELQVTIDKTEARAKGKLASIFAVDLKEEELKWAEAKERIADRLKEMNEEVRKNGFWTTYFGDVAKALAEIPELPQPKQAPTKVVVTPVAPPEPVPLPAARPQEASAEFRLKLLKEELAVLGAAITPAEQLKEKQLELAAAGEKNSRVLPLINRGLAAFVLGQKAAALAIRESLGVASEQEIIQQKLAELEDKRSKGLIKGAQEIAIAEGIIRREAKATAEAEQVRASRTPELTRALIDAGNAAKQFDQIATNSFNSAADAFADIVTGTKNVKDAVHDMVNSLIRDLSRAAFKSLIASLLGPAGGGVGAFAGLFGGARAGGGSVAGGTAYQVGEHGTELFVPGRSGTIIPNDVLRQGAGGTPQIYITNHVDATGADVAAVSRLTAALVSVNRSIESRAVAALSSHRMLRG